MARLHALRRRGSGIRGYGFPKGVTPEQLRNAIIQTRDGGRRIVRIGDHELGVTQAQIELDNFLKMQDFWKSHDRKQYHGKKYSRKWQKLSEARYASLKNWLETECHKKWQKNGTLHNLLQPKD